jgi:hypothetical protein
MQRLLIQTSRRSLTQLTYQRVRFFHSNVVLMGNSQRQPSSSTRNNNNNKTSFSYSQTTYTSSHNGKTVTSRTTVKDGHRETYTEESNTSKSISGQILSGVGSVLLFPVKLLGTAALNLVARTITRKLEGAMGQLLFGTMEFVSSREKEIAKNLKSLRVNGQLQNERHTEDYVKLRAFQMLQTHPLVHEVIAKRIYKEGDKFKSDEPAQSGFFSKISDTFSSVKKKIFTETADDNKVEYYLLMSDAQLDQTERVLVSPTEIQCNVTVVVGAIEDDASGTTRTKIENYKEQIDKVKAQNPQMTLHEVVREVKNADVKINLRGLTMYRVNIEAKRRNATGAPYVIERFELLDAEDESQLLLLDQIIDDAQEQSRSEAETTTEQSKTASFKSRQIIDADYTEK